jgi:hypothetical protein
MKPLWKAIVFIFVFSAILMPLTQLPFANPETSTLADLTLAYIKDVLPIDTNAYNITLTDLQSQQADYSFSQGRTTTFSIFCAFDNNQVIQFGVQPQGAPIASDRQYIDMFDTVRRILRGLQAYSGFDSTEMLGLLGMINPQAGVWDVTSSNNARLQVNSVNFSYSPIKSDVFAFGYRTSEAGYWTFIVSFSNGFFSNIQDLRMRDNYVNDNATVNMTKEQAINTALNSVANYSYIASDGKTVNGFSVSKDNASAELLTAVKAEYQIHPCWTVVLNLSQTYPDNVSQLFVDLWADTGQVFAVGNLAETRYPNNTIANPTPTPSTSPSPFPSSSPSPSASSSPSPSSSQTSSSSATPNPTNNPSPSQSLPPSQEPTSSPTQNQPIPPEDLYAIAIAVAIIAVAATALVLRRRLSKQETTQLSGASE